MSLSRLSECWALLHKIPTWREICTTGPALVLRVACSVALLSRNSDVAAGDIRRFELGVGGILGLAFDG